MHLLPANLASMSDLAAKDTSRYAIQGVHLRVHGDNTYRVMATTSKIGGILTGSCDDVEQYPEIPGMATAPNGQTDALIPAKTFKTALKPLARKQCKPILQNTAVIIGEHVVTFGNTDLERSNVTPTRQVEGRFPPMPDVIPTTTPIVTFTVNAELLAQLATVAAKYSGDPDLKTTIEIRAGGKPIVVRTKNATQTFTGVIMPIGSTVVHEDAETSDE